MKKVILLLAIMLLGVTIIEAFTYTEGNFIMYDNAITALNGSPAVNNSNISLYGWTQQKADAPNAFGRYNQTPGVIKKNHIVLWTQYVNNQSIYRYNFTGTDITACAEFIFNSSWPDLYGGVELTLSSDLKFIIQSNDCTVNTVCYYNGTYVQSGITPTDGNHTVCMAFDKTANTTALYLDGVFRYNYKNRIPDEFRVASYNAQASSFEITNIMVWNSTLYNLTAPYTSNASVGMVETKLLPENGVLPATVYDKLIGSGRGIYINSSYNVSYQFRLIKNNTIILYGQNESTNETIGNFSSGTLVNLYNYSNLNLTNGDVYIFSVRVTNANGTYSFSNWLNSSPLTIEGITLINCSGYTNVSLFFSAFNENYLTPIYINASGSAQITYLGASFNTTFNYRNVSNFSLCYNPANLSYVVDLYMNYISTGGQTERYYVVNANLTNGTYYVNLYNFDNAIDLSRLKLITYNYYYAAYPNLVGKLQRYYPGENLWRTVQVDKTDEDGALLFWVYQNTKDYKVIWENQGSEIYRTSSLKFICDEVDYCESSFALPAEDDQDNYAGMTYTSSYNNNTGLFTLTWADTNTLVTSVTLIATEIHLDRMVTICNTTLASSSGSIICNLSTATGIINIEAIRTASPADPFYQTVIEKITATLGQLISNKGLTKEGTIYSFLIMMVTTGMGIASGSIVGVVVMGILGLVVNFWLGLGTLVTYSLIVGVVFVGAVILYVMRER